MKNIKFLTFLIFASGLITFSSCGGSDDDDPEPTATPTYTSDIQSITSGTCALVGCHTSGSPIKGLTNYNEVRGFAQDEVFLKAIKHESGATNMPQGGSKLSDATISTIEAWINGGLLE